MKVYVVNASKEDIIFIWSIGSTFSTSVQVPWWALALIISLFLWGRPAKGAVGISSKISQEQFIEASRALGANNVRIVLKHILPNIIEYYFSSIILSIPRSILIIALIGIMGVSIGPNIGHTLHKWFRLRHLQERLGGPYYFQLFI